MMRLAVLSALAKLLRIRFRVDGIPYGALAVLRPPLHKVGRGDEQVFKYGVVGLRDDKRIVAG